MANDLELAWAAGLFEGSGQIRYYRDMLGLKLSSGDLGVVQNFHRIVGYGSVRSSEKSNYEWSCSRQKDCREIMIWFWPHIGFYRKEKWNECLSRREEAFYPRICPVCKEEFRPIRKKQICCGQECSAKHTRIVGKYTDRKPSLSVRPTEPIKKARTRK